MGVDFHTVLQAGFSSFPEEVTRIQAALDVFTSFEAIERSDIANITRAQIDQKALQDEQNEDEKKKDRLDDAVRYAGRELAEARSDGVEILAGFSFTDETFDQALRENLANWEEFSEGMDPETADKFKSISEAILQSDDPDEKRRLRQELQDVDSEAAAATAGRAQESYEESGRSNGYADEVDPQDALAGLNLDESDDGFSIDGPAATKVFSLDPF